MKLHTESDTLRSLVNTFIDSWNHDKVQLTCTTSGTTGPPKSITHTKDVLYQSSKQVVDWLHINKNTKIYLCLPSNTIAFYTILLIPAIIADAEIWIDDPVPSMIPYRLDEIKPNVTVVIPDIWKVLSRTKIWQRLDLSECQCVVGSDFVPKEMMENIKDLNGIPIHSYGATEVPPMMCYSKTSENLGEFSKHLNYKIIDNELYVKWSVQKEWFQSGDLVRIENGRIKLLGRKKICERKVWDIQQT